MAEHILEGSSSFQVCMVLGQSFLDWRVFGFRRLYVRASVFLLHGCVCVCMILLFQRCMAHTTQTLLVLKQPEPTHTGFQRIGVCVRAFFFQRNELTCFTSKQSEHINKLNRVWKMFLFCLNS